MKRYWTTIICALCFTPYLWSQSTISRDVTVEHEYKPSIAESEKVESRPVRKTIPSDEVTTPEYSMENPTATTTQATEITVLSQQKAPVVAQKPGHGEIEAGLGHPQTLLRFHYGYDIDKRNSIDVHLHHHAEWGLKTDEKTGLGFDYRYQGDKVNCFLEAEAGHEFFTYYGRYYHKYPIDSVHSGFRLGDIHYHDLTRYDKQHIWRANIRTGVQSKGTDALNWMAWVEYHLHSRTGSVTEHTITEYAQVNYRWNAHLAGLNIRQMNYIHVLNGYTADAYEHWGLTHNSRHCFRIEPYYEWSNQRLFVHAGVNLDFNIGKGEMNSVHTDDLTRQVAFAPSPNVRFEALVHPKYVLYYLEAKGSFGTSSMEAYYNYTKYMNGGGNVLSHYLSGYRPLIAETGFRFQAAQSLLMNVHAGYEIAKGVGAFIVYAEPFDYNRLLTEQDAIRRNGFAFYSATNYQRWKVGGSLDYHYRDILELNIHGDWYKYTHCHDKNGDKMSVYDRPNWEIGTKIAGHIDEHWSLYTWDTFMGKRLACVNYIYRNGDISTPAHMDNFTLPVYIDVNLGLGYQFAHTGKEALDRLSLAFELKNFINRKNMTYFGYESEGINGLVKAKWSF